MSRAWRGGRGVVRVFAVAVLAALGCAGQASAASGEWNVRPVFAPANIAPGGRGEILATMTNLGNARIAASEASPMEVSAQLPPGVTATSITFVSQFELEELFSHGELPEMSCELATLTCASASGSIYPYETMEAVIHISIASDAQPGLKAKLSVSGGGVSPATSEAAVPIGSGPTRFGIERFEQVPLNADGSIDTQAGSHPFQLTTTLAFNQGYESEGEQPEPLAQPKNLITNLPPGLFGNPNAVPQCPIEKFDPNIEEFSECPPDTMVGVAMVALSYRNSGFNIPQTGNEMTAVYNLTPSPGEPARFGFLVYAIGTNVPVYLDTSIRTGGGYGVVVSTHNTAQELWLVGSTLSFWGAPGDPRHNSTRGFCLYEDTGPECETHEGESSTQAPLLTLPTSCTGLSNPLTLTVEGNSWEQPGEEIHAEYALHESSGRPLGLNGCDRLNFSPEIKVAPDSEAASSPSGLSVDIHVPQTESLVPEGLAEASVRNTTVTLPEGVTLSPAAADGLEACSEGLVGFTGFAEYEPGSKTATFTPQLPEPLEPGVNFCPDASKIGTVNIKTPLLPNELTGAAYLATQDANPFGSLLAMYIVARDPVSGVLIKLAGEVKANPATGQLTATFDNSPQLPFEDLTLHFFGGNRAPLSTPTLCGDYKTSAVISPWAGSPPAMPSSTFRIDSGPDGSPCADPLPFAPSLTGGTTSIQAGGFSPLTMTMSREDGNQNLQAIQLKMPPGLSGLLSGVKLCGEAEADAGTCGPESQIGETTVSVGLGGNPFSVTGGKVYITGPYEGAPFGLSIVVPAKAGPFDLQEGRPVVVRAKIEVNPTTSALTITTDDSGPYKIPTIIEGIPLQIKHVNVTVNRPDFTFNPTNCDPLGIAASLSSTEGATSNISVPYQVTNCATLGFAPKFAVSTSAKTSRADGASLSVKLTYPQAPFGSQANLARVKVELPKQLPSRLSTLQKACTTRQFEANPAGCPATSIVGHAKAVTPLLPVPLEGPAYFVSHGGEAFPSLIVVLQGDNVTLDLVGTTFISKSGVTSSTFKTVPDAPVGSFELMLPEGPYSALGTQSNLCKSKLTMPTEFVAQNGAEIHESTRIAVTGCPKAKKTDKHRRHGKHATHARARGKKKQ